MEFAWDDGGRREAFPDWPKRAGDCVSRGISIYTGLPYAEVYKILNRAQTAFNERRAHRSRKYGFALREGRHADGGTNPAVYEPFLRHHGMVRVWKAAHGEHGLTADEAFSLFGDCLLRSQGANGFHVVAIKGGKLRDTWDSSRRLDLGRSGRYERNTRYCEAWVREDLVPEDQRLYQRPKVIREVAECEDRPVPTDVAEKLEVDHLRDAASRKLIRMAKTEMLKKEAARLLAQYS